MKNDHSKRRRLLKSEQPISRLFPNMVTIAGLCCGLSAIRFAMIPRWDMAVAFIIAAALIDGMDGRLARMLGATSVFGAHLDSLSDFVCFGVSPVLILYMWHLHEIKGYGWAVVLFFSVCAALRLARFNTGLFEDTKHPWEKQFFVGVPAPAGGILCLLPLFLHLLDWNITMPSGLIAAHVLLVGTLMASRIPTFAGKHIRIKHDYIPQFMIASTFLLVVFIIEPWLFLSGISLVYLVSIYMSARKWSQLNKQAQDSSGST